MQIILSKRFQVSAKKLAKRHPSFIKDLEGIIEQIKNGEGIKISRLQGYPIALYKTRMRNSSICKGKSSGFRIIYHVIINKVCYLLAIYSKNDSGNIKQKDLEESIDELDL